MFPANLNLQNWLCRVYNLVWSCWTKWSCWTQGSYWNSLQDSRIRFGHVGPYDYVELSGCRVLDWLCWANGHAELFFKILKSGLVMLNPMVMLNFLVVLKKRGKKEKKSFLVVLVLYFVYCVWSCTVQKSNTAIKNISPKQSSTWPVKLN